ncbi:IS21-like element helper ATPase IstB [Iodobacter sp. LRB]|uniref:IS21-like element helper ATPase IstB n=1 Tax=unclassified Iodobacter TaxID=235634 RepID=UPI000C1132FC|nr:IS21-like element helper ATPase IstB [Iodobacter sp. BJB302]PHV02056.1 AAA family ATPase [Iodobacter sp. BJB302]
MLNQQTLNNFELLKLHGMAKNYREQLTTPTLQALSFDERLGLMLDRELIERENKKSQRLLNNAKLQYPAHLEDIDYSSTRRLDRQLISNLYGCGWIERNQNIFITGATGTGKSWLACAFGSQACRQGFSVSFKRASKLYEELHIAMGDGSLPRYRSALAKVRLLIIDDFGLAPIEPTIGYTLLDIVDTRMQAGSLIITSQLSSDHWYGLFSETTLAEAILDRIVHQAHQIQLAGESMRKSVDSNK